MAGRKDWDPRGAWPRRIQALEELPRNMVGDGGTPNLYFVTVKGNVLLISQDFEIAYRAWREFSFPAKMETGLEDRQVGVLASVEPDEATGRFVRHFTVHPQEMIDRLSPRV